MTQEFDLNLTPALPRTLHITAGESQFEISTDLPPSLLFDIRRWWTRMANKPPGRDPELDELAAQLIASALDITMEAAKALGGGSQFRLLDFLGSFPFREGTTS